MSSLAAVIAFTVACRNNQNEVDCSGEKQAMAE
jgi:hypothetical protein